MSYLEPAIEELYVKKQIHESDPRANNPGGRAQVCTGPLEMQARTLFLGSRIRSFRWIADSVKASRLQKMEEHDAKLYFYSRAQIQTMELKVLGTGESFVANLKQNMPAAVRMMVPYLTAVKPYVGMETDSVIAVLSFLKWMSYCSDFWQQLHKEYVAANAKGLKDFPVLLRTSSEARDRSAGVGEYAWKNCYAFLEAYRLVPVQGEAPWTRKNGFKVLPHLTGKQIMVAPAGSNPNEAAGLAIAFSRQSHILLVDRAKLPQQSTEATRQVLGAFVVICKDICAQTKLRSFLPDVIDGMVCLTNLCKAWGILKDAIHGSVSHPRRGSMKVFEEQMQNWKDFCKTRRVPPATRLASTLDASTDQELRTLHAGIQCQFKKRKLSASGTIVKRRA